MPCVISPLATGVRGEYASSKGRTSIIIEVEDLTADQVEQIMARALEMICDARGVAKPRLVADRTRLALAAALDAG